MVFQNGSSASKPLPLKQRTSSKDTRRDYSHSTWISLLVLLKVREFLITVDNFSIWRRHLAWAMENGKDLRAFMSQRYGNSMVFMSLLLSTELGVLFNSAGVTSDVRLQLREGNHDTISFWAGFMIIISALLTLLSLISLFTAWGMVNAIDEANAHCIFRSSIGQYAAELPGRLIVCSIYTFLISFMMFFFLLLPVGGWSIVLLGSTVFLFIHIVSTFSSFGRVIMHTGAMGKSRIFTPEYEEFLLPHSLHSNLLTKAQANLANNTSIIRQYRRGQQPIDRHLTELEMYDHLSRNVDIESPPEKLPYRPRSNSIVRFADQPSGGAPVRHSSQMSTLSAISDASSFQHSESSFGPRPSPPSVTTLNRRKNSLNSVRPPPLPAATEFPPRTDSSVRTVSNSSLEQWLQASPSHADQIKKKVEAPTLGPIGADPLTGTPTTPKTPDARQDTLLPSHGARPVTIAESIPPTPTLSDISLRDRDLTESERFALDYGEVGDIDASHNYSSEYRVLEETQDTGERTGLLDSGNRGNYQSSTPAWYEGRRPRPVQR